MAKLWKKMNEDEYWIVDEKGQYIDKLAAKSLPENYFTSLKDSGIEQAPSDLKVFKPEPIKEEVKAQPAPTPVAKPVKKSYADIVTGAIKSWWGGKSEPSIPKEQIVNEGEKKIKDMKEENKKDSKTLDPEEMYRKMLKLKQGK